MAAWDVQSLKDARPRLVADCKAIHAVPGGNAIVQEEDRGSNIAFTLSQFDYQRRLADLMNSRVLRAPIAHPHPPSLPARPCQQHTMSSLG